jgi:hypothetical protein
VRFWIANLLLLPLCAWALVEVFRVSSTKAAMGIATWLIAAVILHDLVLLPLYSAGDRAARLAVGSAINYVRVPAALSLLMLLVFWGTIRGKGDGAFHYVSGLSYEGYFGRWLLVSAALFAISGAVFLVRRGGSPRRT